MENNFYQIVKTTDEEKFEMYNNLSKKEFIRMLIQDNKMLDIKYNPYKHYLLCADKPLK